MSMTFYAATITVGGDLSERIEKAGGPELNLSQTNAARLLSFLGYDDLAQEGTGEVLAEVLAERIREALATIRAMPDLDVETPTVRTGNWFDCGTRAGWLTEKLQYLLKVAEAAGSNYISIC